MAFERVIAARKLLAGKVKEVLGALPGSDASTMLVVGLPAGGVPLAKEVAQVEDEGVTESLKAFAKGTTGRTTAVSRDIVAGSLAACSCKLEHPIDAR